MSATPTDTFDFRKYADRRRPGSEPLGKLFDREPPRSAEAEMALLGSMILDPGVIADVIGLVHSADQFHTAAHGAIFQALVDVYNHSNSGDLVQIQDRLREGGVLEEVGGSAYLLDLADTVPGAINAPHYARIVAEKAKLRRLIEAAGQILYDAYHSGELGPDGARVIIDEAERSIFEIAEMDQTSEPQALGELLQREIEQIEAIMEGKGRKGVPTGYHELDEKLNGLQPSEMIVLAARPSMGKTALALNIAEQVALGGGGGGGQHVPVAIFSLEMSKGAVASRMLSARSGVDAQEIRSGRLSDENFRNLLAASGELREAPIHVDDTPGLSVLALRARARRLVAKHGVRVIIVDYLQLMTSPGAARESRQVEVSTISRGLKALARELNVPVVCVAQLNRATEQHDGNRPRMSNLRESGSIEQDADVVMLLHREEYYHIGNHEWIEANEDKLGLAELIIAKQRNGPTGVIKLTWDDKTTRFKNHAGHVHDAPPPEAGGWSGGDEGPPF